MKLSDKKIEDIEWELEQIKEELEMLDSLRLDHVSLHIIRPLIKIVTILYKAAKVDNG